MNDEHEARLRATLQEQASRAIPATTDLWPALAARVGTPAAHRPAPRPAIAWGRTVAATLVLIAVAGAALLLAAPGRPGLGGVGPTPTYPVLSLTTTFTQTVGDYTLIIRPVYNSGDTQPVADGNQVVLTYRVLDATGQPVPATEPRFNEDPARTPRLTLADGTELPWLGNIPGPPQAPEGVLVFDTSGLPVVPASANLRLQLGFYVTSMVQNRVSGPYTYYFNLAFDPQRRVAVVGKSVTTNGITITLDWVSVTRSVTRLSYHITKSDGSPVTYIQPTGQLTDGRGWTITFPATPYQQATIGGGCDRQGYCQEIVMGYSPVGNKPGNWSLKIDRLIYTTPGSTTGQRVLNGPWLIPFTMPNADAAAPPLPPYPPTPVYIPGRPTTIVPVIVVTKTPQP